MLREEGVETSSSIQARMSPNPLRNDAMPSGCGQAAPTWHLVILNPWIYNLIREGSCIELDSLPPQRYIPINPPSSPLFLIQFTCLPFGISSATHIFSKMMSEGVSVLTKIIILYLYNILVVAEMVSQWNTHLQTTIHLLQSMGWIINWESWISPTANKFS